MREGVTVKTEEVKALTTSVKELTRDYVNMAGSVRAATNSVDAPKKLWKTGNRKCTISTMRVFSTTNLRVFVWRRLVSQGLGII